MPCGASAVVIVPVLRAAPDTVVAHLVTPPAQRHRLRGLNPLVIRAGQAHRDAPPSLSSLVTDTPDTPGRARPSPSLPFPPPTFPSGDYAIQEVLGTGGMAVVYRARDLRRQRAVAIKVLRGDLTHVTGSGRFRREIVIASSFAHPHIVPLLDFGDAVDALGRLVPFYVMPLVEGETLRDRLARTGPLPVGEALRLIGEILGALDYAHRQGIVHRDIKPANVLLAGGRAMVADFGVSRPLPWSQLADAAAEPLTQVGLTVGTPAYMSPEQMLGDASTDARADLYAVGCVLFELLAGRPAFPGTDASAILTEKLSARLPSLRAVRDDVPPALERIVHAALAPRPADRYDSADAMLRDLASHDSATFVPSAAARRAPSELETSTESAANRFSAPDWAFQATPRSSRTTRRIPWFAVLSLGVGLGLIGAGVQRILARDPASTTVTTGNTAAVRAQVAVLPFESPADDAPLTTIAGGLTADLVDELSRYPALRVVSREGTRRFADGRVAFDSVARALSVASLVTGSVARVGDSVRVTVRLIDGATATQLASARLVDEEAALLRVRERLLDSVTLFLRRSIGEQVVASEREQSRSLDAWELLARVRALHDGALAQASTQPTATWVALYAEADSLTQRAAALDPTWAAPWVWSARLLLQRALLMETTAPAIDSLPDATTLRQLAVQRAGLAIERNREEAYARYLRGRALLELWRTSRPAPDSLRLAAESDLRLATTLRQDLGDAWADLSTLLQLTGNYEGAHRAAQEALRADAFLRAAPSVIGRLLFTSLATGRADDAARWCREGRARFDRDPRFWGCDLTIVGWTGRTRAAIDSAWQLLAAAEARDAANVMRSGRATRRLLVAAVVARAGLADSARAIVTSVRNAPSEDGLPDQIDYGEAHVETLLGNTDRAMRLLERYLAANPALRGQVRATPWFATLRGTPRFDELTGAR